MTAETAGASYALVVVDSTARELSKTFTYRVPPELLDSVFVGSTVEVPFGHRHIGGYVVALQSNSDVEADRLRDLTRVIDPEPVFGRSLLHLAEWLRSFYGCSWRESLLAVVPAPVLTRVHKLARRKGKRSTPAVPGGLGEVRALVTPSEAQDRAVQTVTESLAEGGTVLLHGITGSGKTEVYIQCVSRLLGVGRQALVMVPEVALTPQAVDRYRGALGDTVAVLHSGLSPAQRRNEWWRLRSGESQVALGTRSAVFAPLGDPGLFVLDEEHDSSYKQDNSPRYHARQVAAWRVREQSRAGRPAALLLGSATPCLESYYLARQGRYRLVELQARATGASLPEVTMVDMRAYHRRSGSVCLSGELVKRIREVTTLGQQVVLLLNRRGYSRYMQCTDCGYVARCRHCSISLTYHRNSSSLDCHYCSHQEAVPDLCPECRGLNLQFRGSGTERLEQELRSLLPGLEVARLDRDSVGRAGSHAEILGRFARGEAQILVGTQMVAKGLDFPHVTLVGVLSADAGLNLPDFRAGERTFQLLTQVSGRAGRAHLQGEVVVQAMDPQHPCLVAAARHDFESFYQLELEARKLAYYPPFCRLVRILVAGPDELEVSEAGERLARSLARRLDREQIVGPAPCALAQLKGMHRWHLLLKGPRVQDLMEIARNEIHAIGPGASLRIGADPDPQSLL